MLFSFIYMYYLFFLHCKLLCVQTDDVVMDHDCLFQCGCVSYVSLVFFFFSFGFNNLLHNSNSTCSKSTLKEITFILISMSTQLDLMIYQVVKHPITLKNKIARLQFHLQQIILKNIKFLILCLFYKKY
jgi:hypothetical protein